MTIDVNFIKKFEVTSTLIKLSNYSWFNLGGEAEYFYKANDKNNLKEFYLKQKLKI